MRGLPKSVINVPLMGGLSTKFDPRALQPPGLAICKEVEFDKLGGLQTRHPYELLGLNLVGGGAVTNPRTIVENGLELLLFSKDALYSRNEQLTKWSLRGTHLAVKVKEEAAFVTTGDQIDGDRAELSNTVVYAWTDTAVVYVAAVDKTTGSVTVAPTPIAGTAERPRLVALATKILLFWHNGTAAAPGALKGVTIDPADVATSIGVAGTVVVAAGAFNLYYDATRIIGADTAIVAARRNPTTSYELVKVTAALALTAVTKARVCDSPIAVSVIPDGTGNPQIVRTNAGAVQGDFLTAALADITINQAIGTSAGGVNQLAAAHRSVKDGGNYRCYVFWSQAESNSATDWVSKVAWADTGGALGAEATFVRRLGIASRAFDYDGRVFVWGAFAGESTFVGANLAGFSAQLQNTYFLYRDDATYHAKAAAAGGGGFAASIGRLPGVALTSGTTVFSWCGSERRVIEVGVNQKAYADRGPRDITFTFDSNEARRCVRLGATMYVTGGEILQYDGVQLVELGFHIYPWHFAATENPVGNLAAGTYAFKEAWRSENAKGEIDRSTCATVASLTIAAGPKGADFLSVPLYITKKTSKPIAVETFRAEKDPQGDSPFYLVTSKDPAVVANPNRYIANDATVATLPTLRDEFSDATLKTKENHPENGAVVENMVPPAATIIAADADRLYLGGIAGDPHRIWYSKTRNDGEVASFHEENTVALPRVGGDLTAIAFDHETLIAFKATAIYQVPGDGLDNVGGGSNFGPPRLISGDLGAVSAEAVAPIPIGIVFKSSKGWQLLSGFDVVYIGGPVADYDAEDVVSIEVVEAQHQVRIITTARMLTWDYQRETNQWSEWAIAGGLGAVTWQGKHVYLTAAGPSRQRTDFVGTAHGLDIELGWIKPADLQGAARVWRILLLGEWRSAHAIRARIAYNYDPTYIEDRYWPATPAVVGGPEQVEILPKYQQCEAIKLRLTAVAAGAPATLASALLVPSQIVTDGVVWTATLTARPIGVAGNAVALSIGVNNNGAAPWSIEIRDGQKWNALLQIWTVVANNIGVKILGNAGSKPTVADLEAYINARSFLASVTTPDVAPGKLLDMVALTGTTSAGAFAGGIDMADVPPTGEALRLTGLGFEVGAEPGLFKRLPAAQRM